MYYRIKLFIGIMYYLKPCVFLCASANLFTSGIFLIFNPHNTFADKNGEQLAIFHR